MNSLEKALRTVRSQMRFEVALAAARVSEAADATDHAHSRVNALTQQCADIDKELRRAMQQPSFDPAPLAMIQNFLQFELRSLERWRKQLEAAKECEYESRAELARLRHHDRSLEGAVKKAQRAQESERRKDDFIAADDLWLQHSSRGLVL